MGAGIDKQLVRIGGKPVMVFSLERLLRHPAIGRVIVVTHESNIDSVRSLLVHYRLSGSCEVIAGGASRQESVVCGLAAVKSDRVIVHEGARPLIDDALIERVVAASGDAVVPTVEVPFTVAIGGETMTSELDRSTLHNVQLLQAFDTDASPLTQRPPMGAKPPPRTAHLSSVRWSSFGAGSSRHQDHVSRRPGRCGAVDLRRRGEPMRILITGASKGIGAAIAAELATQPC